MEHPEEPGRSPPVAYAVEAEEGALRLRIQVGPRSIPVAITPDQAAVLGQALLAASVLYAEGREAPPGRIDRCDLPVLAWRTGVIKDHGLAVLIADVLGGAQVTLQFQPDVAVNCGRSLLNTGKTLKNADE